MQVKPHLHSFFRLGFFAAFLLLFLTTISFAADATLAWDPNSEADLAGYGVYYFRLDDPAAVYNPFGYVALEDLDAAGSPTVTVTELESGVQYQFAVTAYNTLGNESKLSIPVCAEIGTVNVAIACPLSDEGGDSSGGGGGGGCFIGSASGGPDAIGLAVVVLSLLWIISAFRSTKKKRAS